MKCPRCSQRTRVTDCRLQADTLFKRRRECQACKCRFSTYEEVFGPIADGKESRVKRRAADD